MEVWEPIGSGFKYHISNYGRVRRFGANKVLSLSSVGGYSYVNLCRGGNYFKKYIHLLVGHTFVPNNLNKPVINHIDGNKINNLYSNLEWCTYSENTLHALDSGLSSQHGEGHSNAKLSETQVLAIREYCKEGTYTQTEIARVFKVSRPTISNIVNNVVWNRI